MFFKFQIWCHQLVSYILLRFEVLLFLLSHTWARLLLFHAIGMVVSEMARSLMLCLWVNSYLWGVKRVTDWWRQVDELILVAHHHQLWVGGLSDIMRRDLSVKHFCLLLDLVMVELWGSQWLSLVHDMHLIGRRLLWSVAIILSEDPGALNGRYSCTLRHSYGGIKPCWLHDAVLGGQSTLVLTKTFLIVLLSME